MPSRRGDGGDYLVALNVRVDDRDRLAPAVRDVVLELRRLGEHLGVPREVALACGALLWSGRWFFSGQWFR
jgi:hypothetical protein